MGRWVYKLKPKSSIDPIRAVQSAIRGVKYKLIATYVSLEPRKSQRSIFITFKVDRNRFFATRNGNFVRSRFSKLGRILGEKTFFRKFNLIYALNIHLQGLQTAGRSESETKLPTAKSNSRTHPVFFSGYNFGNFPSNAIERLQIQMKPTKIVAQLQSSFILGASFSRIIITEPHELPYCKLLKAMAPSQSIPFRFNSTRSNHPKSVEPDAPTLQRLLARNFRISTL